MSSVNKETFFTVLLRRKVAFLFTFFITFLLTYGLLAWLDFLPEPKVNIKEDISEITSTTTADTVVIDEVASEPSSLDDYIEPVPVFPDTIIIDALDRTLAVLNPTSRTVADLDAALLYGVVRHPDSATPERAGTVFILGHSSYLPAVLNNSFKAFNGIQNLKFGDTIRLQALSTEYVYRIDRVYRARAQDVTVPIAGPNQRLVLATCNSFGSTDDRYIVEGELVETRQIVALGT